MWRLSVLAQAQPFEDLGPGQSRGERGDQDRRLADRRIMAISRTFQNGRVSWTPTIWFMASMMATNRLDDSQSKATRPNEMMPVGGFCCRLASSRSTIEAASRAASRAASAGRCPPLILHAASSPIQGRNQAVRVIVIARNGTRAAIA